MITAKKQIDMLNGPLLSKLLMFSLPIMASGILQLLYNAADVIIVGRFAGKEALAAVGTSSTPTHLFVNVCVGLASGVSIIVAQSYGAKNAERVSQAVHTCITLSLIVGVLLTTVGIACCGWILRVTDVPDEVYPLAYKYIFIFLLGMPANMLYNCAAGAVRATGDTKKPLYILIVSGLINVILNVILVKFFLLGVEGVAIATVVSQILSAILIVVVLIKSDDIIRLKISKITLHIPTVKRILAIGVPASIQSTLFTVSNLIINAGVNSFGTIVIAGSAAASNIEGFAYVAMNSISQTSMTFTGQNYGAGKMNRISKIYKLCSLIVFVVGVGVGAGMYLLGNTLIGIYNSDPDVIAAGMIKLTYICLPYVFCGFMEVTSGALRGIGKVVGPTIITLVGVCALRVIWMNTVFKFIGTLDCIYISYPVSWFITFVGLTIYFICVNKKMKGNKNANNTVS